LLPEIPKKLCRIDDSTRAQHFFLDEADRCFYIWEYAARKGYSFSPSNQLISNLKIEPSQIAKSPGRNRYKQQAISHSAAALRKLIGRATAEGPSTFIPVPGSKALDDADYDDRLIRVLQLTFENWNVDFRSLLKVTASTEADHKSAARLSFDELRALTRLKTATRTPLKPRVIVVDDVLNSGKHFKVAQSVITESFPDADVRGLFLARCVRNNVADEFDAIDDV